MVADMCQMCAEGTERGRNRGLEIPKAQERPTPVVVRFSVMDELPHIDT